MQCTEVFRFFMNGRHPAKITTLQRAFGVCRFITYIDFKFVISPLVYNMMFHTFLTYFHSHNSKYNKNTVVNPVDMKQCIFTKNNVKCIKNTEKFLGYVRHQFAEKHFLEKCYFF